jgi:DNA-binding response OmpR family regulator
MKNILLVEDDGDLRSLLKLVLEEEGYEVVEAEDGRIALNEFTAHTPDLVITDIVMPDKEGLELIKELKRLDSEIKIIAMSGGARNNPLDYLNLAKYLGADYIIDKPFDISDFIIMVGKALA